MTDSFHCDLPTSRAQFGEMGGKGVKLESLMSQGRLLLLPACAIWGKSIFSTFTSDSVFFLHNGVPHV